jgi:hypothetical protein
MIKKPAANLFSRFFHRKGWPQAFLNGHLCTHSGYKLVYKLGIIAFMPTKTSTPVVVLKK